MSRAVVMRADLTIMGVNSGCAAMYRAASPVTCGADIDVPDSGANRSLPFVEATGEYPAMTPEPGAVTSGLRTSPSSTRAGPREENAEICGVAVARPVVLPTWKEAVAFRFPRTYATTRWPAVV